MTEPEKRIEEVIAGHRYSFYYGVCRCELDSEAGAAKATYIDEKDHSAHVAAALVEALGLKQESSTYEKTEVKAVMGGKGAMAYGGQTIRSLGWRTSTRLVSEWVEQ